MSSSPVPALGKQCPLKAEPLRGSQFLVPARFAQTHSEFVITLCAGVWPFVAANVCGWLCSYQVMEEGVRGQQCSERQKWSRNFNSELMDGVRRLLLAEIITVLMYFRQHCQLTNYVKSHGIFLKDVHSRLRIMQKLQFSLFKLLLSFVIVGGEGHNTLVILYIKKRKLYSGLR